MTALVSRPTFLPQGLASVRKFLQSHPTPVLLLTSSPQDSHAPPQEDAGKHVSMLLSQALGLRTVPTTPLASSFITKDNAKEYQSMAQRTGATTVVAVGNAAVMDAAKEIHLEQALLVPTSYEGILASGTRLSMVLDPLQEQTIFPTLSNTENNIAVTFLEEKFMRDAEDDLTPLYAAAALAMDTLYRAEEGTPELISIAESLLKEIHDVLADNSQSIRISHEQKTQWMVDASALVSTLSPTRSICVGLAASLLPPLFPHMSLLQFWASLTPGLGQAISNRPLPNNKSVPRLTLSLPEHEGFSIADMAISHIHANQTACQAVDVRDDVLLEILQKSVQQQQK